jgi:hypothetical protein
MRALAMGRYNGGAVSGISVMHESEGVIQFDFTLRPPQPGERAPHRLLAPLNGWRRTLRRLGLIGQDPARYGGLGFGNVSLRDPSDATAFFISASQTGGLPHLEAEQMVRVSGWDFTTFSVVATGQVAPSSEALTHAMLYEADARIAWVIHGHSPMIWQHAASLGIPATAADAGYGSPAMAASVHKLLAQHRERPLIFVTPGHEDGVFAAGDDIAALGPALIGVLTRACAKSDPDATSRTEHP